MDNKYLADFQIIGNSIRNLKIKNDFISLKEKNDTKKKIDISHSIVSVEEMLEEKIILGTIVLNIKVSISSNKKKYNLDMVIEGCFNAPLEMGEDTFVNMLKVNGITSLYSIARGFVQSTTSQTLVEGNVLLPMLNVVAYSKDLDKIEK